MLEEKKTTVPYKVIRFLVWLFFPKMEIVGAENLPDGPALVVGNHTQMNGPIAGELYFPGDHYIWCAEQMMNAREVPGYAFEDFWSFKPKWTHWFFKILAHLITPLSVCIFNNAHTIPVYRDARVMKTIRESMRLLEQGARIIIYPERNEKFNNILYAFQDGFVDTARFYHRKTGAALPFVPMYIAPALHKMIIGRPILFDPTRPIEEERKRVCDYLMKEITDMACALPRHRVVPYRNIPKKDYPFNTPSERS